jgi:hypothetical protein
MVPSKRVCGAEPSVDDVMYFDRIIVEEDLFKNRGPREGWRHQTCKDRYIIYFDWLTQLAIENGEPLTTKILTLITSILMMLNEDAVLMMKKNEQ